MAALRQAMKEAEVTSGNYRYVSSSHGSSGTLSTSKRTIERSCCFAAARPELFCCDLHSAAGGASGLTADRWRSDLESSGPQILRQFDTMLAWGQVASNLEEALQLGRLTAPSKPDSAFRRVVVADGQGPTHQPSSNESGCSQTALH